MSDLAHRMMGLMSQSDESMTPEEENLYRAELAADDAAYEQAVRLEALMLQQPLELQQDHELF